MTITLAAVYTPIAFQGGLTGSLFREFALTLAGAVTISGVVALTLSPVMSADLLTAGHEDKGLSGLVNRTFERIKATYARHLDVSLRGPRRHLHGLGGGQRARRCSCSPSRPRSWRPTEDQGVIFGIVNTPVQLDARPGDPLDPRGEPDGAWRSRRRTSPSRSPSRPAASGASGSSPGSERQAHRLPDPAGGAAARSAAIPGIQTFAILPPALPGGGNFPVEFVLASTAETAEILGFAKQLQQKAAKSGMFAFPPLIDVKIDQPESRDRDRPREGGRAGPQPPDGGPGPLGRGGRQLRQPLQRGRAQLQGHPAARCASSGSTRSS